MDINITDTYKCLICMDFFKKPVVASDGNVYCTDCISTWSTNNAKGPTNENKITSWTECSLLNKFYMCGYIRTDMNLFRLVDGSISDVSKCNNSDDALKIIDLIDNENSHRLKEDVNNITVIAQIFSNHTLIKKLVSFLDKNWYGIDGWNILHYIFRFGSADLVNFVLDQGGYDLSAETDDGWQLIHFVSSGSNMMSSKNILTILRFLVECGVNLENPVNCGWYPIHYISSDSNKFTSEDQLSALNVLSGQGIDINVTNNKGFRAIHYVCSEKNHFNSSDQLEAIKLVAGLSIDVDPVNNSLMTPIKYLMSGRNNLNFEDIPAAFTILVNSSKKKLDFNTVDANGNSIAHHVCNSRIDSSFNIHVPQEGDYFIEIFASLVVRIIIIIIKTIILDLF